MSNSDFYRDLKTTSHQYLLCDLHVHSIASADVLHQQRFDLLSESEKDLITSQITDYESYSDKYAEYDECVANAVPVDQYFALIEERRNQIADVFDLSHGGRDWAVIAVTDHNSCQFSCKLSQYAWDNKSEKRIVILPGLELDVEFTVAESTPRAKAHICLIYPPGSECNQIHTSISQAVQQQSSDNTWNFGETLVVDRLDLLVQALRNNQSLPAICVAAHVSSSRGVREASLEVLNGVQAEFSRLSAEYEEMSEINPTFQQSHSATTLMNSIQMLQQTIESGDINLDVLKLIGRCGFDALQVASVADDIHYRCLHRFKEEFGRAVTILFSDAHRMCDMFSCGGNHTPYIKFPSFNSAIEPEQFFLYLKEYSLRFGETRCTSVSTDKINYHIKGIEISPESEDARRFWPFSENKFVIPFSQNLNCLIGGRGSGKSAMIEALAFALGPDQFNREAATRNTLEKKQDWYKRAYQTLAGCNVKVCWTSTSSEFAQLEKRSVFISRYFDGDQDYQDVDVRDMAGGQVLDDTILSRCQTRFYRMGELESLATDEGQMRELIDSFCGGKIQRLAEMIGCVQQGLSENRERIKDIVAELASLTIVQSPLRTFVVRKKQYDDVNTTEIREKCEKLDEVTKAKLITETLSESWRELSEEANVESVKNSISHFFTDVDTKTKAEDDTIIAETGELRDTLLGAAGATQNSLKDDTLTSVRSLITEMSKVAGGIETVCSNIGNTERAERDSLVRDGLPAGSQIRTAKKMAYEEAERALEKYQEQTDLLTQEMRCRELKFNQLKRLARIRTLLRTQTAQSITEALCRHLDPSILVIEVDARPMVDKQEYFEWLEKNLFPSGVSHKDKRIGSIIEASVMPETISKMLLGEVDSSQIVNDRSRARDGRINNDDAEQYIEFARVRSGLSYADDMEENGITPDELPDLIRDGIWAFSENQTKINEFLKLDEIVFDDIPEIRLKDRPEEMENARPVTGLSAGQRCSAILPIILLNGDSPLIIDQPEDNLDNRLIREVIVNILASMKLQRQVIIATHNPNLPVLGDVEQAIVLRAVGQEECQVETQGDIEMADVVRSITDVMEGGREAFQYRHSIYRTHWEGAVEEPPEGETVMP